MLCLLVTLARTWLIKISLAPAFQKNLQDRCVSDVAYSPPIILWFPEGPQCFTKKYGYSLFLEWLEKCHKAYPGPWTLYIFHFTGPVILSMNQFASSDLNLMATTVCLDWRNPWNQPYSQGEFHICRRICIHSLTPPSHPSMVWTQHTEIELPVQEWNLLGVRVLCGCFEFLNAFHCSVFWNDL